ncbi:hypothetical protein OPV22_019474 [Ensete ventricosum]|uniref:Beta-amylase n=1 Tax=Ensete ventricosum TaxID=4639 RepID=A0AAV8QL32_ENSVE|nr:hypothetical protein OPV22_019474 [Ensete ventricosum]
MAAIAAPPSSVAAFVPAACARPAPASVSVMPALRLPFRRHGSSRLYCSKSSSGFDESLDGSASCAGIGGTLHPALPPPTRSGRGVPVFVTLPADAVTPSGRMTRRKTMGASFMALAAAGVEGITVECWWGIVEREAPGVYDWGGYMDLVMMARRYGLKVRAIIAFHQWGTGPGDPYWIPLPQWVLKEMDKEPDLAFSDRDTFKDFLGVVVTEIQVGMGPSGELAYPIYPTEKLIRASTAAELGEFQCYDKYMLASLSACAQNVGMSAWEYGAPPDASDFLKNPEETASFSGDGSWNTPYGSFFLEWYSGLLLHHGERLCITTGAIFMGTGVKISAKVGGMHWRHYSTNLHPTEITTTGYYNTVIRDGYLPILRMFARHRMTLCCPCFDLLDSEEKNNSRSGRETFLRQLLSAARMCNLPLAGENSFARLDESSLDQVIYNSGLYYGGAYETSLSFNYVRMNRNLFDSHNWNRFTRFMRRMSNNQTFLARLDSRGSESFLSSISDV